ncbi:MAG: carboxylating nicotinate-nucleotide diphosphorylase [Weeksellaceae bacterium]|nr:carboxylating nicotinate-nucleotide diphosphorylase [Weeksellaceae bacterium]
MQNKPWFVTEEKLKFAIQQAFIEDIGSGDHSTLAIIPLDTQDSAQLLVKDTGILAGVELAQFIFHQYDPELRIEHLIADGTAVQPGDIAFRVHGSARSILSTERLVLNCMQRMGGIASLTHTMAAQIAHTQAKLLDTRKTTPNFRLFEKWAVSIGGGHNHRFGLYDMIMLKDNHIDFAGGITRAVQQTRDYLEKHNLQLAIEVETRNMAEVEEALRVQPDRIMLDNFSIEDTAKAVILIDQACETEASGGITLQTLKEVAETGVDYISSGALTHSAHNMDLSLKAIS